MRKLLDFDTRGFMDDVDKARITRRKTWQDISIATGVDNAVISRVRSGQQSLRESWAITVLALAMWADLRPTLYVRVRPAVPVEQERDAA